MQIAIPLVTAGICLFKAREARMCGRAEPWFELALTFVLWAIAQVLYFLSLVVPASGVPEWASDALWLVFPFPLLVVAFQLPQTSRQDAVSWLDIGQAALFFTTLFALAFTSPALVSLPVAYSVQSIALLLACVLRYSMYSVYSKAQACAGQIFYRKLAWFSIAYAVFSVLGYLEQARGLTTGTLIDFCWTAPFSFFAMLAVWPDHPGRTIRHGRARFADPTHLHGISAHCLTAMSLTAAAVLAFHRPRSGGAALLCAFVLSAARTTVREWQMQRFHARLEYAALHDVLTGLPNRQCAQIDLAGRLEQSSGKGVGTGILFINIDRFQLINDGLGYPFGDLVIQQVARLLGSRMRVGDLLGRSGGDEFVLLLGAVTEETARLLAEEVLHLLQQPITVGERVLYLTGSAGVAIGTTGADAAILLQAANCAMYRAKRLGRDQVQVFAPEMLAAVRNKHRLYTDLRTAIDEQRIEVFYQPIYRLDREEIAGFEALARWQHLEHGWVSPAEFVPLAEDTGLVVELGRQILFKACAQCSHWNRLYQSALSVSVNVSAHQFAQPGLLQNVQDVLAETGLHPSMLKLEVTESVLLSGFDNVERLLRSLRAVGVGISLDDFGTGYSSLSYMLQLPFDVLKIDQSFVRHLHHDARRAQIVQSVIDLATKLEMKIVAEGVESREELQRLREYRCDMVQGFLLSKPLHPRAVCELLDRQPDRQPDRQLGASATPSVPPFDTAHAGTFKGVRGYRSIATPAGILQPMRPASLEDLVPAEAGLGARRMHQAP